ncbi:hypothetical protein ZIOFF_051596 [Zingiber officinale]|uniref:Uncharacterized protein n=1 Tax=Zingiber officinale TaxID=94328 RepID=A0A8J5KS42_ZINOF|nr:hypothetical protein ZIOFF_051596 [Zingiber officinale]
MREWMAHHAWLFDQRSYFMFHDVDRDVWGVEKLVYRDAKRVPRRDRKYAVWPLAAFAAGVHMSQNIAGRSLHKTEGRIKYFHYHGTIADRRHPCREFVNPSGVAYNGTH